MYLPAGFVVEVNGNSFASVSLIDFMVIFVGVA
jgi:hypothetical protein